MKKIFAIGGFLLLLAIVGIGALWYFSPDTVQKLLEATDKTAVASAKVEDFHLLDHKGRSHYLQRQTASKAVVLISTANECPTVREAVPKIKPLRDRFASQGVVFWMLDSGPQDDRASIAREAEASGLDLPVLEDRAQLVANALSIERTCEIVCINTTNWTVFYRGAIDQQLADKKNKSPFWAPKNYLENALTKFLAHQRISPSRTLAKGTPINFAVAKDSSAQTISYASDVAPILQRSCVSCHSPGNIGPFAMSSYEKVKGRASTILEVLQTQRMPPWHADPHYGAFVNARKLTPEQAQTLAQWIEQGAPRGEGDDPLAAKPPPEAKDWPMGQPDFVVKFPKAEEVAATGVFDYRYVYARSPIPSNAWLRAAVVRPGNKKVVHHILVLVATQQELQTKKLRQGQAGGIDGYFSAYVPGYEAVPYPEGTGKLLPAGSVVLFQVHYTATGKPEKDMSELGLYLCKEKPAVELRTRSAFNAKFKIPPGAANSETEAEFRFVKDSLLYEMSPHMHLRGSWFKYEAVYPDGKSEVLLSVPNYDFKWQHLYRLAQPKRLPAGTRLVCRGAHDNSAQNPDNPDPSKEVRFGDQTFDEMFIGYFNYSEVPPAKALASSGSGGN